MMKYLHTLNIFNSTVRIFSVKRLSMFISWRNKNKVTYFNLWDMEMRSLTLKDKYGVITHICSY